MTQDEMEEIKRHFDVVAEGLRSDIRLLAEGHEVLRREIGDFRRKVQEEFRGGPGAHPALVRGDPGPGVERELLALKAPVAQIEEKQTT